MAIHYVATDGTDTWANSTNIDTPCSLNTAISNAAAGDLVYLRGGTYQQLVTISANGTAVNPIVFSGYTGETAIIDGYDTIPLTFSSLVRLTGDYIEFKSLTIQDSYYEGITLEGDYDKATDLDVVGNWENGIRSYTTGHVIDGCIVHYNDKSNEYSTETRGNWQSGIQMAEGASNCTIKNCIVYNNWGEGIDPYGSSYTTVEDCIIYDNLKMQLYLDRCTHGVFQRNLIYVTSGNICSGYSGTGQYGIFIGDENATWSINQYNKVINNMVVGCQYQGLRFFKYSTTGTGILDTTVANNTFVNAFGGSAAIKFDDGGTYSNSVFENNICLQEGAVPCISIGTHSGLTFDYNNWSKTPDTDAAGAHDQVADPLLAKTGSLTPGNLTGDYCKVPANSPAVDHGLTLASVSDDFFKVSRPVGANPDIGAYEYTTVASLILQYRVF